MDTATTPPHGLTFYTKRQWRVAALTFVAYYVVYGFVALTLPDAAALYPAAAVAIAGLFFGGLTLWPVVFFASLLAGFAFHVPYQHLMVIALADTLQGMTGAWMLRKMQVDPLFRRYTDMFGLVAMVLAVAVIFPSLDAISRLITGAPYASLYWGRHYAGVIVSLLVGTPFLLRWCAKAPFSRSRGELIEMALVFALLLGIQIALFVFGIADIVGIYLIYLLLFPLFWIALRLRPRFITLALVITTVFAIWNTTMNNTPATFGAQLFSTETFLITLSVIFLIIVSLEEDRRLNTNLMRSQLSTLENAIARISSESQAKNDFIAVLAHELRNPLAPVVSAIDYLKLSGTRDAEELETLDMMEDRMGTVKRLLDDLLDVSRISEGKLSITKEKVDLDATIRRAILSTDHHIKERHQELVYKPSKKKLWVEGDPVRLEQVFSNLITNASKYSDSGDPITISASIKEDQAEIVVSDRGIGIPQESLGTIFTPFHQLGSGARTQKGLGIGLALVQSFVEVHGGRVIATSEGKGKGSSFSVLLPLMQNDIEVAKSK
ncbi:MAG: Two-component system, NarL family, capsular synthesis sensor histidine kinase RcsC [Parcubacteria group bacterium]|nr:Two-component system, NarL family, capsular synthesis sensor histidine kinase RcsC [Parcubacteria group bacterium]